MRAGRSASGQDLVPGRRLATGAIRALFQVADIQKRLVVGALKPVDVILDLGVNPGVKVRYREGEPRVA